MSRFHSVSVILFVLLILSFNEPLYAVDLNAPAEKKVTIGSEIERGWSAISDRTRASPGELPATQDAIFSVLDQEKQRNTDTDAFYLGAYYRAFLK